MASLAQLGGRHRWIPVGLAVLSIAAGASVRPALAQSAAPPDPTVAALQQELADLRQRYEARLADLEKRLAELEAGRQAAATPAPSSPTAAPAEKSEEAELAALAAETAGGAPETTPDAATAAPAPGSPAAAPAPAREAVFGSERNLNRLNPEISMTGDLVGVASNRDREDFRAREFELNVQSALDPYSFTKWTVSFAPGGQVDVEEGYVGYNGLPGGLQLLAGKFRQNFGALNRWHLHALPQLDYPLALQTYFGEEGLSQTGLALNWLLPHPWASANEINVELTDGRNEAFGGDSFKNLTGLVHLKNFWDVNDATYAEWGLSGIAGTNGHGGESRVYGTDLTFHWQPPTRAKYREITWRTELLRSERGDPARPQIGAVKAWGGYSYVESLVAQNVYAGLRYDRVEDPLDPGHVRWGLVPNLTWWQSEFVRLRGEYNYLKDRSTGRAENRFSLQLTWAAGPHKHETY